MSSQDGAINSYNVDNGNCDNENRVFLVKSSLMKLIITTD